jgi:hypothetical protein
MQNVTQNVKLVVKVPVIVHLVLQDNIELTYFLIARVNQVTMTKMVCKKIVKLVLLYALLVKILFIVYPVTIQ